MSSAVQVFRSGPRTYAVTGVVAAGQMVSADQTVTTNGQESVKVSAAGDLKVIGVAITDAAPAGTDSATDAAARPAYTTVASTGVVGPVTFAAASKFGDRLKAAANGQVTPFVDGTDTDPSLVVAINVTASVAANGTGNIELV